MIKRTNKYLIKILCISFSLILIFCSFSVCASASESYISEIAVATGKNGISALEEKGYTVLFQGMNLETDGSSAVFIGYKKGTEAITGLVVSSEKASTVESDGVTYKLAFGTDLNYGTTGTPVYLYYTKDQKAGSGIKSLDTVSGFSDTDEVLSIKNDGSSPVRTVGGAVANFDAGIDNSELYLLMYRGGAIRQYISDVCFVTGATKSEAVNSAAGKGCDYFLDYDLSDDDSSYSFIAYQRTSEKSDAVTGMTINGSEIKTVKDPDSGAYLIDMSEYKLFSGSFTLGDWADIYASSDKTFTKASAEYKELSQSKEACSISAAGKIFAVYLGEYKGITEETSASSTTVTETVTETASEPLTDDYADISREDTTSETSVEADEDAGSVFGTGNTKSVIILTAVVIIAAAGFVIYRKRKEHKDEKDS